MDLRISFSLLLCAGSIGFITALGLEPVPVDPVDCSLVRCGRPTDCEPEDIITPAGECCPVCPSECSPEIACALPLCKKGEVIQTPPGKCCPECVRLDCSAVLCQALECEEGETLVTPPGECCAKCEPELDCSTVLCQRPRCSIGETTQIPEGECCPVCVREECPIKGQVFSECASACPATCDAEPSLICITVCLHCTCPLGQVIDTVNNKCVQPENCPPSNDPCAVVDCKPGFNCKVNATTNEAFCEGSSCPEDLACALPLCKKGEVIQTPPGKCCPECVRLDCSAVLCQALECEEGETLVTPPGECCAKCEPELDCSTVLCQRPRCPRGQSSQVPEGECCPVCIKDECPIEGQVFSECGSACPATCDSDPNQLCILVCVQGCACPFGLVIDSVNNRCVQPENCPSANNCPFKGQEFSFCPGCDSTCIDAINESFRPCLAVCRPGCGCPRAQLVDTISGQCVPREECTNPCAVVDCKPGFSCKVNATTNEAFCEESSCPEDLACALPLCKKGEVIQTPPGKCCPECVPTGPNCAAVLCQALTEEDCEEGETLVTPPGECCAKCEPELDCSTVLCRRPRCPRGQSSQVPEGECCPVCIKDECPIEGQVFSECGSACPATCDSDPNQICILVCVQGCACPFGLVIDSVNNRCVRPENCPSANNCPFKGQEFSFCPGCDSTCIDAINESFRPCLAVCRPGCGCPRAQLVDTISGQCVPREECTNPCAVVDCKPGFSCKVNATTNEAFCEESSCPEDLACALPLCKKGEVIQTPPGKCCPECVRLDCSAVLCQALECEEGETLVTPPGECCAKCEPELDCSTVFCSRPLCKKGQILDVPEGECCPVCRSNCSTEIACALPLCKEGQVIQTVPGKCCPVCVPTGPNCAAVLCQALTEEDCDDGEAVIVPRGECCAICQASLNCSAVSCLRPICAEELIAEVPEGQCCPVCTNPCALVDCMRGSVCKVDAGTNQPFCEPSCDIANGGCAKDQFCQLNIVQCFTTPCPPEVECLQRDEVCSLPSESGPCKAFFRRFFHNSTSKRCEQFIYGGCRGNANNFESLEECQMACGVALADGCSTVRCRPSHRCEIFEPTGETFCTPDCGINNGGCSPRQLCSLQQVQCVRAPCPPVIQCLDQCATVLCKAGHRCETDKETGNPVCIRDCSVNNGGCSKGELCTVRQVQCVRAPCPSDPVIQCLSPCAAVRCSTGHSCKVDEATGSPFCSPDCKLDNGGCRSDQICELKPVFCESAPCPPRVQCSCPPPCSREFCSGNPKGLCSRIGVNFGPVETPGCTGDCQLTYCKACFYSRDTVVEPALSRCRPCLNLKDYSRPSVCYFRWAKCVGNRFWRANRPNRRLGEYATDHIQCIAPTCPKQD